VGLSLIGDSVNPGAAPQKVETLGHDPGRLAACHPFA
jgi:hypothetical protein